MFTICKGSQNIVQDILTDKAAKVRNLLLEADAIIIGAGADLSTAAVAVMETLNKQVFTLDPKAIRLSY